MTFWLIASLLTLLACLAVMLPFLRRPATSFDAREYGIEVYRDQLSELERDAARGLIGPAEAEQARLEISRRILALQGEAGASPNGRSRSTWSKVAASVAVLSVPLLSWGLYSAVGSPAIPDQPLQARLERNPAENTVAELIARAERHLTENPSDGRGWDVLAPIYLRTGRNEDAAVAFRSSISLNGESAARVGGLGEALTAVAGGIVTAEAMAQFRRTLELSPSDPRASYFVALAYQQEGRTEDGARIWQEMATVLPQDDPWREAAVASLSRAGISVPPVDAAASDPDVIAGAGQSNPQTDEMIEGMVAGLDARLRADPEDLQGWQRLIRSYLVLGRKADAQDALDRGSEHFGERPERGELVAYAAALGLNEGEVR